MNSDLVSIIIPVYNASRYIADTIQSVASQTYFNWELLIIDDGSTDDSNGIIKPFLVDKRIKLYEKKNTGVSDTRNFGLARAKGNWVLFLDADDILNRDFIQSKQHLWAKSDVIGSKIYFFSDDIRNTFKVSQSIVIDVEKSIFLYDPTQSSIPSSYLFKKSFLVDHSIVFDPNLSSIADRDLLYQCTKSGAVFQLDNNEEGCMFYRVSKNSMSHAFNSKLVLDNEVFYSKYKTEIDKPYLRKGYEILFKSFFKIKYFRKSLFYLFKYLSVLKKRGQL